MKLRFIAAALALAALPAAGLAPAAAATDCTDATGTMTALPAEAGAGTGGYVRPAAAPTALVVFAHGYSHESPSWEQHMVDAASRGAIAVTPDYSYSTHRRGWHVTAGARDMIAAANYFLDLCGSTIRETILFGVSMGANTSGLAVADKPMRDGAPLFDVWFDIEGAVNVIETYAGASALADVNEFARNARDDIEAETGGTIADVPAEYLRRAIVTRVADIEASGIKGVVLVHGVEDGLVPYNQSREIVALLRAHGVAADMTTVGRKGDGENGTTISGYATQGSPFAGHGSEASATQRVIRIGHDRLHAMLDQIAAGTEPSVHDQERVVDDAAAL